MTPANLVCKSLVERWFPEVFQADMLGDWLSEKSSMMLANNMIIFNNTSTDMIY